MECSVEMYHKKSYFMKHKKTDVAQTGESQQSSCKYTRDAFIYHLYIIVKETSKTVIKICFVCHVCQGESSLSY